MDIVSPYFHAVIILYGNLQSAAQVSELEIWTLAYKSSQIAFFIKETSGEPAT